MDINNRAKKDIDYMYGELNGIDINKIKSEGVTIRLGDRLVKMEFAEEKSLGIEEEIRNEFREKLTSQLQKIKDRISTKINEMSEFVNTIKREYDRKEQDLKNRLNRSHSMPDVTIADAQRGLSVVKGSTRADFIWLVQGIYWPKYVNFRPIKQKYSKKLLTNIIFMIETRGNQVTRISTRKPIGLGYFSHYHQSNPDCWGQWKYNSTWESPEDIIKLAKEAEAVLENVNTGSIANNSPSGLPRRTTLEKHIVVDRADMNAEERYNDLSQVNRRMGIIPNRRRNDNTMTTENNDVWEF